jgi:hypothetical protein
MVEGAGMVIFGVTLVTCEEGELVDGERRVARAWRA